MSFVRRSVHRQAGTDGLYRRPIRVTRTWLSPVSDERTVRPGAGTVLIQGPNPVVMPLFPGSGPVIIQGNSPFVYIAERIVRVGGGEVTLQGSTPIIFLAARLIAMFRNATRRRYHAARYSINYPPPSYDVTIPIMIKALPGRIVQMTAGEVEIEGPRPALLIDNVQYAGAGASEVLIQSVAPYPWTHQEFAAGASVVWINGGLPLAYVANVEYTKTAGSSVVDIVGYNPGIEIVIGWSEVGAVSATWSATTTVVGSWSDVVVTTSVWTRQ